jgi:hypothetical protein
MEECGEANWKRKIAFGVYPIEMSYHLNTITWKSERLLNQNMENKGRSNSCERHAMRSQNFRRTFGSTEL